MLIYLVRHGQKPKDPHDPQLTKLGQSQAQQTANFFSYKKIDRIISSPYQRAIQTAQPISEKINLSYMTEPLLSERAEWTDELEFNKFVEIWRNSSIVRDWIPPVGDSSYQAGNRLEKVITDQPSQVQQLILVCHGGIITDFLRNIASDEYLIDSYFQTFENLRDTQVPNCSITTIEKKESDFKIKKLFSTSHLSPQSITK